MTVTTLGYRLTTLLTIVLVSVTYCKAQLDQSARKQPGEKARATQASSKLRVDEIISRLSALASEAQTFEPPLRSHIQTQAASLLWDFDRLFARDLFLKAWEAAESADREFEEKQQRSDPNSVIMSYPPQARREVISAAWKKDPVLGDALLAKMIKQVEQAEGDNESSSASSNAQLSRSDLERLNVAMQLLRDGDETQAVKFAQDILNRALIPTIRFLSELREKNATAADDLYVSLLARVVTDPTSDANSIALLSSYVFSPFLYFTIGSNGLPRFVQNTGDARSADVPPRIRSLFLDSAAQVLLRAPSDPAAQRISYMVATRLLPLFEKFNPNLATQIKSRLSEISGIIPPGSLTPELVNKLRTGINNPDYNENVQEILGRAKQLTNASMRNRLYIQAAMLAAEQGNSSAKEILQEVDGDDLRDRVRAYVYMVLARHALRKKDLEAVLEFARCEALSPVERVWIYTQAVDLFNTKSLGKVTAVIMESVAVARRIDSTDPDRARALTAITLQLMRYKPQLAKAYLIESLIAVDKANNFDSENGLLEIRLETPVGDWFTSYDASNFRLKKLFRELAKEDFFQAINMSENLKSKEARSAATIAIGEIILTSKNIPAP